MKKKNISMWHFELILHYKEIITKNGLLNPQTKHLNIFCVLTYV